MQPAAFFNVFPDVKSLSPYLLSLLFVAVPACDITIEDGGGDTDGAADSGDDDDDDNDDDDDQTDDDDGDGSGDDDSGNSSGDSGETDGGDDDSGNDSGDSGNDSGDSSDDSGDSGNDSGDSGNDSGDSGNDSGDSGDTGNDSGDSGDMTCDDTGICQDCYDCSISPGGSCSDAAAACAENQECIDMSFCYDDCVATSVSQKELEACLFDCEQTFPDGVAPFVDLLECAFNDACVNSCAP